MASNNPFAALPGMLTPDTLSAQREQAFEEQYKGANPWIRGAARIGFDMRQQQRKQGIGLEPEDVKARLNESILSGVQSRYAQLVQDGKMTADEAQAAVLEEAIAGFASNGSWEQALALTQPLNELRAQKLERDKLKAEIGWAEARPDVEAEKAAAATTRAEVAAQLADLKAQIAEAKTGSEVAKLQAEVAKLQAMAGYYDRMPKEGGSGGGKKSVYQEKEEGKMNAQISGAATAMSLMAQVRDVAVEDPGALTGAGPLSTALSGYGETARALVQSQGYDPTLMDDGKTKVSDFVKRNVRDQKLQALVTDLAFAFARSRDPGGRLSNQDVENAIKIVSGAGAPAARMAVLDQAVRNLDTTTRREMKIFDERGFAITDAASTAYEEAFKQWGKGVPSKKAPPKGAAPPVSLLKPDGSPTPFKNGQVWRLVNGKAVRVK